MKPDINKIFAVAATVPTLFFPGQVAYAEGAAQEIEQPNLEVSSSSDDTAPTSGTPDLQPSQSDDAIKTPDPATTPSFWKEYTHKVGDDDVAIYHAPAQNAKSVLIYASGTKSSPIFFNHIFEKFRDSGISVIGFELARFGRDLDFMERNKAIFDAMILDKESPIYDLAEDNTAKTLMTHSASGTFLEEALMEPEHDKLIKHLYTQGISTNPFFDTANSSFHFYKRNNTVYSAYARRYAQFPVGEAPCDNIMMGDKDTLREENADMYEPITHGQAIIARDYARGIMEKIMMTPKFAHSSFARKFISGDKDIAACHLTTDMLANQHLGVQNHTIQGAGHMSLRESPAAANFVRRSVLHAKRPASHHDDTQPVFS